MRTVIAGHPLTGKTTLAEAMQGDDAVPVRHTDETIDLGWSEGSQEVSTWFDAEGPFIIEGVSTPRALRKWLERNAEGRPCDTVVYLTVAHEELTKGQRSMAKGCDTVFNGIKEELEARGVEVTYTVELAAPWGETA